jgi:hypothetical protein
MPVKNFKKGANGSFWDMSMTRKKRYLIQTRFDWSNRRHSLLNCLSQISYQYEKLNRRRLPAQTVIIAKNLMYNSARKRSNFWLKSRERAKLAISKVYKYDFVRIGPLWGVINSSTHLSYRDYLKVRAN